MAVGVSIVSTFDGKGIQKAIKDFRKLEGVSAKGAYSMRTIDKAVSNGVRNVAKYGSIVAGGLGLVAFNLAKTAEDAQVADRAMLQVATSMGLFGAETQQVVDRLTALATKQQVLLGIDEDTIKATQTKLLTFKNLAATAGEVGGAFDRATMAALDLAAAGFGDATQNATQLGKALQDPIKGITALARSGVTFTAQEKEKIAQLVKSNQMFAAQDALLKAIETQVGGTAEASAKATDKIMLGFGEIAESLGTVLLPYFEKLANYINSTVVPYVQRLADVIGEKGVGAGVKLLAGDLLDAIENMDGFGNVVYGVVAAFIALKVAVLAYNTVIGLATALGIAFQAANPFAWIAAAIAVVIVAIAAMYVKFQWFRDGVNAIANFLIGVIENMVNQWIKRINFFIRIIDTMTGWLGKLGIDIPKIGQIGEISFGRLGKSAENAGQKLYDLNMRLEGFGKAIKGTGTDTKPEIDPYAGVGASVKSVQEKLQDYRQAVLKVVDANKSLADATQGVKDAQQKVIDQGFAIEGAQRKVAKATDDVTKAINNVARAQKDTEAARSNYSKSIADTAKAQDKLALATKSVQTAQDAFNKALAGYGANSKQGKDAQRSLSDAQRDAEQAGYDYEKAQYAVIEAEAELAAVRSDAVSTPQMIREAEIGLAEAKLRLIEAQIDQADSQDAVTAATDQYDQMLNGVRSDSQLYKDLLDDLNEAKANEKDAIDAVTAAREAETAALDAISEALANEAEAAKAVEDAKYAQAEAERDLEAAKRDQAAAIRDVAAAQLEEAQSILALAEAQKQLNQARKNAPAAGVAKIDAATSTAMALATAAVAAAGVATATGSAFASFTDFRGNMPALANGGIVTKPTVALMGERGPEAVVPLSGPNAGLGTTINLTVNAGMGTDGAAVGNAIVDALRKYQRLNGAIPITVAA